MFFILAPLGTMFYLYVAEVADPGGTNTKKFLGWYNLILPIVTLHSDANSLLVLFMLKRYRQHVKQHFLGLMGMFDVRRNLFPARCASTRISAGELAQKCKF